ncbi:MAG: hypothetical protein HYT50_00800 [Candidatus Wildermuthbacteria bacterium]|nr:hypothetical protein [Candidatus Wildermuthbacteria bacterium]
MNPHYIPSWQKVFPNIENALQKLEQKLIVGFGITPYPRIVPALFLKNYLIYSAKDTADLDIMRSFVKVFCLEEKFPKAGAKVHAASYLLGNYGFQAFVKSRREPFYLLLHRTTPAIVKKLEEQHIEWIGNDPASFEEVALKTNFQELLAKLNLSHAKTLRFSNEDFATQTFQSLFDQIQQPFQLQRIYSSIGMEQNPFLVSTQEQWEETLPQLSYGEQFQEVFVSPIPQGLSLSMVGCATHLGVLTSSLHLRFLDIPEILGDERPSEIFLGHDFQFSSWNESIEDSAQTITENVGAYLEKKGYRGIFSINFVYDQNTENIVPQECTPQFPEDLHIYSLMIAQLNKVPPMDVFHLMEHLQMQESFDFQAINAGLKERMPLSHVFLRPKGIQEMKLLLSPGVYSFSQEKKSMTYIKQALFPWEARGTNEFLLIDSVPRHQKPVIQDAPSLFKLVFPRSIAMSSSKITPDAAGLIARLRAALLQNQQPDSHKI